MPGWAERAVQMYAYSNANNKFMTAKEAAEILQCSVRTVMRMCERGDLKCCKAGSGWRINRNAFMKYASLNDEQ